MYLAGFEMVRTQNSWTLHYVSFAEKDSEKQPYIILMFLRPFELLSRKVLKKILGIFSSETFPPKKAVFETLNNRTVSFNKIIIWFEQN